MIRTFCDATHPDAKPVDPSYQAAAGVFVRDYAHGCVVAEREANYHDDSDFYATYYDRETGTFKEVCFASTRGWCYPLFATCVDATHEVQALWEIELSRRTAEAVAHRTWREATTPARGKRAVIDAKRGQAKHLHGQEGDIFWAQEQRSQYGTWSRGWRVGIAVGAERVFVSDFRVIPQLDLVV